MITPLLNALQNERDLCWGTTSGFSSSPVSQIAALFHISGLTALERACWSTAFFSIWHQYVEALPPSWFAREAEPVLAELGETVVLSRRIGAELSKMKSLARTTSEAAQQGGSERKCRGTRPRLLGEPPGACGRRPGRACDTIAKIQRVESKRVDAFENMTDDELRQYVYGNKELDS